MSRLPGARAQATYPGRNIKLIVPYPAGGTTDLLGRLVADQIKSGLNAVVVVENKPGAATTLGAEQVARSEPDGYTIMIATSTTLAINKTLYKKLPYDPVKDFAPISLVAAVPFALIINPGIPAKTLPEFIAYAKANPGLAYGSAGNGSPHHLGAEMLRSAAGIDIRHVPYRGSVPAMLDVIAGHIPFMVVDLQPALQQIKEGKLRVLGVTTSKRVAAAPDIPTLAEGGLSGYELVAWQGIVAPAGTPRLIVDALAAQIAKLLSAPETRDKMTNLALEILPGSTPAEQLCRVHQERGRPLGRHRQEIRRRARMNDIDVLIVGAGPVGVTLAIDLAWRGIAVTVVETRARAEPPEPKCNHVAARTMEIFRRLGVAERCAMPDCPPTIRTTSATAPRSPGGADAHQDSLPPRALHRHRRRRQQLADAGAAAPDQPDLP